MVRHGTLPGVAPRALGSGTEQGRKFEGDAGCQHTQLIKLGWDAGWERAHAAGPQQGPGTQQRACGCPYLSRNQGRGKYRTSPEWYFQAQWVESLP